MIRLSRLVVCSLVLLAPAGCKKKEAPPAAGVRATADAAGKPIIAPGAAGDAVEQTDLKAEVGGKAMAPLYGVAQPDPAHGNSHRIMFSTRPLTCSTLATALVEAGDTGSFWVRAHEALRPDGTTTWAFGGLAFAGGGSAPSGLVAMGSYQIDGGKVSGTLPSGATHEAESGTLAVSGSFAVPQCDPLTVPRLRDLSDIMKDAVPIEATGSTARVTVAGKGFDVKGATALRGKDDGQWEVRLTERPHGCSQEVPGNLYVGLRIARDETKIYLGGNWIAGSADVVPIAGSVKVDAKPGTGTVAVTLSGTMDYAPADGPYKVELSGTVSATVCEVK